MADDIAPLLVEALAGPQGPEDVSIHTGQIVSWNKSDGTNKVLWNGTVINNARSVQAGIPAWYSAGDVVLIARKQTQIFILGKVAAQNASAGSGPVDKTDGFDVVFDSVGAWTDVTGFPNTPQVTAYIGSSRSALVVMSCEIKVAAGDPAFGANVHAPYARGDISVAVTGASAIAAGAFIGTAATNTLFFNNPGGLQAVASHVTATKAWYAHTGYGLKQGLNTFTMKYRTLNGNAEFMQPALTVIPL